MTVDPTPKAPGELDPFDFCDGRLDEGCGRCGQGFARLEAGLTPHHEGFGPKKSLPADQIHIEDERPGAEAPAGREMNEKGVVCLLAQALSGDTGLSELEAIQPTPFRPSTGSPSTRSWRTLRNMARWMRSGSSRTPTVSTEHSGEPSSKSSRPPPP